MKGIRKWIGILLLFMAAGMAACNSSEEVPETQEAVTEPEPKTVFASDAYDSGDTAVIVSVNEEDEEIVFWNLIRQQTYTLKYDGVTDFSDKYGTALSVAQLQEGTIADIHFLKEEKRLVALQNSSDVWEYNDVSRFEISADRKTITVSDEIYTINESAIVLSDGKKVEMIDINPQDILHLSGREQEIYSIVIGKGHGYLRLANEDYFIGGWIEVGQKLIRKIEEDMLLVVPEGTYQVLLSHEGLEGVKEVTILRDKETELDVGDLKKEDLIKYGNLIFTVEPASAVVSLDGKAIDITRIVKTEYGLHQIVAEAEGYDTIIQYIRVNQESANVNIVLDEKTAESETENNAQSSVSGNMTAPANTTRNTNTAQSTGTAQNNMAGSSVSGNSTAASSSTTGYKVTINAPEGAEVYVDGNYVGIVPASFAKVSGSHVVTVRKTGYLTRSYTIEVDDEAKDISYSFSELTIIE